MNWITLEKKIKDKCKIQKKDSNYTKKYILYCKRLYENGLPIISSPSHFSVLVGMEHEYVCKMAYSPENFYRHFIILKSNGNPRNIDEPLPDLKFVQKWILNNILVNVPVSAYAKAYVKNRNIKENARFHKSQPVVVTMDIKNFFPSISVYDIVSIFKNLGYLSNVANFLGYLCCYEQVLPQGAPTSPYLSNIRMCEFDKKVVEYTNPLGIRYTRYADDITFSGSFDPHNLIKYISCLVFSEGFSINSQKTRVAYQNARQEVTGIIVNSHMQLPKEQRKKIRQEVYYIKKYGLDSHLSYIDETRCNYLNHLLGKINFAIFINPKDEEMKSYFNLVKKLYLNGKEHD